MANDLWVSKLKKADVPCCWIRNDSTRVVEVINNLNLLRSEIDKASPLLLQFFDFSTLYTRIDLVGLKARMRVLKNNEFNRMLKLHCFKFLMVQKTILNFRFLWLKNAAEINLFENLHSFKVAEPLDLILLTGFLIRHYTCLMFNISMPAKLGVINSQFYKFLKLCNVRIFLSSRWSVLLSF